jgi:hypothetical protein
VEGDWLPPQAPGSTPPPPVEPGAAPPPPAFGPDERPNNEAVAAIVCGVAGAGLLYWTNGLSSLISLILGIFAVVYAGKARRNVEEGRTVKHRDMATGAKVAGWITVGLSAIATAVWALVVVLG